MTGRHEAPGRHEHTWPPVTGEPAKPVWRTPVDGPQRLDGEKAALLMMGWHDENVRDQDCCPRTSGCDQGCCPGTQGWRYCEGFVAARIRGMHHTMFVVPMPYDPKHSVTQQFAILDDLDDSGYELREGFDGYHTALMFAAARCAVDLATETGR